MSDTCTIKAAQAAIASFPGARVFAIPEGTKKPNGSWSTHSTRDPAIIEHLFAGTQLNIGLHIGDEIAVIDVEGFGKGKGEPGEVGLNGLIEKFGPLPPTMKVKTPSGGFHLYFTIPRPMKKQAAAAGTPNVEFRTGPHCVVYPPSKLADGRVYEWEAGHGPGEIELAAIPSAWVDALNAYDPPTKGREGALSARTAQPNEVDRLLSEASAERFKEQKLPELGSILAGCAWMRHLKDSQAEIGDADWYAMLSVVGRCKNGEKLAHAMSCDHPNYDRAETSAKLKHALEAAGPRTCSDINSNHCQGCLFAYKEGHSPITLGHSYPPLVEVLSDAVYVEQTQQIMRPSDRSAIPISHFAATIQDRVKKAPRDQLLSSRSLLKVRRRDYLAGDDRLVVEGAANVWKRGGIQPCDGDASAFVEFMECLIPDPASRKHLLDYIAHLVQKPATKIRHAVMLTGPEGTGKGVLVKIISIFLGEGNVRIANGDELTGEHKCGLVDCQVLCIEEAKNGDDFKSANATKVLITEERFRVHDKYVPRWEGRTPRGIFVTTNYEAGVVVERGTRRWFVAATCDKEMEHTAYQKILAAMEAREEIGAFLKALHDRDISAFNPNAKPPITEARLVAEKVSEEPVMATLRYLIEERVGAFECDLVTLKGVADELQNAQGTWNTGRGVTPPKLGSLMNKVGAVNLGQLGKGKDRLSLWAIRRTEDWRASSGAQILQSYRNYHPALVYRQHRLVAEEVSDENVIDFSARRQ